VDRRSAAAGPPRSFNNGLNVSNTSVIFWVLASFYVWECCCRLRRGRVCLTTARGGLARIDQAPLVQNEHGLWVLTNPLPWARTFVCRQWLDVTDHDKLAEPSLAENAAATCPVGRMTDLDDVVQRVSRLRRATRALRLMCSLLFLYGLIAGPLLYTFLFDLWGEMIVPYVIGFLVCWAATIVCFYFAHRRLYKNRRKERYSKLAGLLFSPASAMRSCEQLGRGWLEDAHAVTVAAVTCRPPQLERTARQLLRQLQYPLPDDPWHTARAGTARRKLIDRLCAVVHQRDLGFAQLHALAERLPDAASYCPRCEMQYVFDNGRCSACGDLPLAAFPARSMTDAEPARMEAEQSSVSGRSTLLAAGKHLARCFFFRATAEPEQPGC